MTASSAERRVLVVDDAADMRTLIRRALNASGYEVDVAATLAEAYRLGPAGYDAMLVDANLGAERGLDLVEDMVSRDQGATSRCLVITGGSADLVPDGVACLSKPFRIGDLLDAVRTLRGPDTPAARGPRLARESPGVHAADTPGPRTADAPRVRAADAPGPHRGHAPVVEPDPRAGHEHAEAAHGRESPGPAGSEPTADKPQAWQLLGMTRALRSRERGELIGFLHDRPIQELTAAALELDMMRRTATSGLAERIDAVRQRLDAAAGALRWLVDGQWPFVRPETMVAAALPQRTAWLLAAPATVDVGEHQVRLCATEVATIADIVELILLALLPGRPPAQAHAAVRAEDHLIQIALTLACGAGEDDAVGDPAADRALKEMAAALGARVHAEFRAKQCRVFITLPRQPASLTDGGRM